MSDITFDDFQANIMTVRNNNQSIVKLFNSHKGKELAIMLKLHQIIKSDLEIIKKLFNIIREYDGTQEYRKQSQVTYQSLKDLANGIYSLDNILNKSFSRNILFKILINKPYHALVKEIEDLVDFLDVLINDNDEYVTKEELLG